MPVNSLRLIDVLKSQRKMMEYVITRSIAIVLMLMIIIAAWQVFSRYCLNSPSQFTDEALRYLMIWSGFLGAAYSFGLSDRHMSLTLIRSKLTGKAAIGLECFNCFFVLILACYILIIGGWQQVILSVGQHSDSMNLPLNLVYAIIPISGMLTIYFKCCNTYEEINHHLQ